MTNTDNYNLLIVEGEDKFNPLTQVNPNFEDIDEIMKENADASISLATEIKSGTVHAITRNNSDAAVFRFVATSAWTTGDTVEVDNVQVSTLKTDGTALETGDYIIGSNVIGILSGTTLTLLVNAKSGDASTLDGHAASYFATAEDLDGVSTVAEGAAEAAADNTIAINSLSSDLTSKTQVTRQTLTANVVLEKCGNIRILHFSGNVSSFTIPSGSRPNSTIWGTLLCYTTVLDYRFGMVSIGADGAVPLSRYDIPSAQGSSGDIGAMYGTVAWCV